jgi:hypothetical protein
MARGMSFPVPHPTSRILEAEGRFMIKRSDKYEDKEAASLPLFSIPY